MSKPATLFVINCRMHIGAIGLALATLAPLAVAATTAEPSLQATEQLDVRRIGKVSDTERAVLRVEWRAALSGVDEVRAVQDMQDSLRRMQGTVGEISRLIRSISAQKSAVEVVAADAPESRFDDKTLALAGSAAVGLLAIWWARRRESTRPQVAQAPAVVSVVDPPAPAQAAPPIVPPVQTVAERPAPVTASALAPAPVPPTTPATLPQHEPTTIDFSLEEADPESIARANARLQKLKTSALPEMPAQRSDSNVDPTLELADIMLSLGLEQGAALTLLEYTEANPRQALHHWLKLLDIYRKSGNPDEFKETAEKLRQNFNIQAEDWAKASAAEEPTLEGFSRLSLHIQEIWQRPEECIAYLRNLLEDNREGARAGFPRPVAEEILLLIDMLNEISGTGQPAAPQRSTT